MAQELYQLTAASVRERWRWALQHLYALLILGPLVFGMTYLTLAQTASYDLALTQPHLSVQVLLAAAAALSINAFALTRASRELYHLRRATVFAESLPLTRATHLHFALLTRAGHTVLLAAALVIVRSVSQDDRYSASSLTALLLFCVLLTLSQVYAALNWIHWGHRRDKRAASLSIAVLAAAALICGLLLVFFFNPAGAARLEQFLASAPALRGQSWASYTVYAGGCLLAAAIYLLTRISHQNWRAEDIEYAQRLEQMIRPVPNAPAIFLQRLPPSVRALVTRDLQLTARIFSSAVYVAIALSVLLVILLLMLLTNGMLLPAEEMAGGLKGTGWFGATWLPASLAIKLTCVCVAASLATIVPVLVYYQLPHKWLERAVGTAGAEVWEAKLWYARALTLPAVLATYVLGVIAVGIGGSSLPLFYVVPLLAECLWLWWLVSTIIGVLAYEMPDRPELALVLMLTVSLSVGLLSAVLWPMGVGIYGLGIAQAKERGVTQAALYLAREET